MIKVAIIYIAQISIRVYGLTSIFVCTHFAFALKVLIWFLMHSIFHSTLVVEITWQNSWLVYSLSDCLTVHVSWPIWLCLAASSVPRSQQLLWWVHCLITDKKEGQNSKYLMDMDPSCGEREQGEQQQSAKWLKQHRQNIFTWQKSGLVIFGFCLSGTNLKGVVVATPPDSVDGSISDWWGWSCMQTVVPRPIAVLCVNEIWPNHTQLQT